MTLSETKNALEGLERLAFVLPNGQHVPAHFHVTEIGKVDKHFIDCGGIERKESVINFQLWNANDYDHRLHPKKLQNIIRLSERKLNLEDLKIEVEYQGETISKYGLDFDGQRFLLTQQFTDCLAKESCGIPEADVNAASACCTPDTGCC